jgi:acetyl-CoA acetyltransferase
MSGSSVAIVGVGETAFARRAEPSLGTLVLQASRAAIADAGLAPGDIDGVVPAVTAPAADDVTTALGARRRFTGASGYVPGAGPLAAVLVAQRAIEAGLAENVLVYHGYKGSRAGGPYAFHAQDPVKAGLEMPFGWYGQPVYFAAWAQRYCHEYGVKPDDFASVAVAARAWAQLSPGAQQTKPLSYEDYQASPMVSSPLRVADCCLITDGAAAFVVTSAERARDLPHPPVVLAGGAAASADTTMHSVFTQKADLLELGSHLSGPRAYAASGLGPSDVDVAMIYDCFSITMVLQMEELGFCPRGEGFAFAADGRLGPGGDFPVNTHGGHLAYAYLPSVVHVIEAVRQLRGTRGPAQVADAEVALVGALGGNDHTTLMFTKDR